MLIGIAEPGAATSEHVRSTNDFSGAKDISETDILDKGANIDVCVTSDIARRIVTPEAARSFPAGLSVRIKQEDIVEIVYALADRALPM